MSTKTTTQQTQAQSGGYNNTNTFGYAPSLPETADISALRGFKFQADPSIAFNTSQTKKQFNSSLNSPMGAKYNPAIQAAISRSGNADINARGAEQASEANQALQTQQYAQKLQLASMTAPQLVNTGSSGTSSSTGSGSGTQVQSQSPLGAIGDVGSSLIMAF